MAEPLIRFSHVRKAFGPKTIYRDLNLDIFPGETLTVMGGSGVGKSVMLKLLIRLLDVDGGSVSFHGEEITRMSEREIGGVRRRIAMLFQGGALFDSISVGENVAYGLREHFRDTMSEQQIAERVDWALSLVGLPKIEAMRPADLSGGMKKRVGLARAIAVQPEVLLYDEPTTGLDPINTERINHLIRGLKKALNVTSIVVTHDMKSAFSISDRMAMVVRGEIIAVGTPDDFSRSKDPRVADFINGTAPVTEDVETLLRA
ncbi:ABC transporter ATP-binding protein [Chondromyces crocatus]|uniref:Organic solvent ABC transporter ATP-binding protein n=1 Tax=Chondromyces crocatus TaxID=52 RepID=A0A0K1ELE7_CHOCO|nr:ATP-binding cassette domain-containing protein [Chondromyces crocatus]AKT41704.1 organic solvent ABC transporter ATP-binding protein [Chondromyces crocatus]